MSSHPKYHLAATMGGSVGCILHSASPIDHPVEMEVAETNLDHMCFDYVVTVCQCIMRDGASKTKIEEFRAHLDLWGRVFSNLSDTCFLTAAAIKSPKEVNELSKLTGGNPQSAAYKDLMAQSPLIAHTDDGFILKKIMEKHDKN